MEPTLECAQPALGCTANTSDLVAVRPYGPHAPRRFDIVVFTAPPPARVKCGAGGTFIKRLIGLPGDLWEERDGYVYINGKKLNEPYIQADHRDQRTLPPRHTYTRIPKGYYLMMGDNRSSSCDSRRWGLVPRKNLIGKVFATYWPPSRISFH